MDVFIILQPRLQAEHKLLFGLQMNCKTGHGTSVFEHGISFIDTIDFGVGRLAIRLSKQTERRARWGQSLTPPSFHSADRKAVVSIDETLRGRSLARARLYECETPYPCGRKSTAPWRHPHPQSHGTTADEDIALHRDGLRFRNIGRRGTRRMISAAVEKKLQPVPAANVDGARCPHFQSGCGAR